MNDESNAVTLTIYSKTGSSLGEFKEARFLSALWRLGETGVARYEFAPGVATTTRTNLRPGNRALIRFGDGLPDWGGVLDWPISFGSNKDISITFYEADRALSWRVSGQNEVFSSTVPGAIVGALIDNANAAYATGVYMGDVFDGGTEQTRDFHYLQLRDAVRQLRDESGHDYAVVPALVGGKLVFDLNWYERRGADRRDELALIEGANVGEVSVSEQGPVFNRIIVVGKGKDWSDDRPVVFADDLTSRSRYGLRESPKLYLDISDETTLQAIADALLAYSLNPKVRMTLAGVENKEPAPFSEYHVGDILSLQALLTYGEFSYDTTVRVLSRQRLEEGTCALEVEEWAE